jgi:hypothetical protein
MCKCIYAATVKIFTPSRRHFRVPDGYSSAYFRVYLNIFGQHNGLERLDVAGYVRHSYIYTWRKRGREEA